MIEPLDALARLGILRSLDTQFAKFVCDSVTGQDDAPRRDLLALAAVWVSQELGRGHVCLPLSFQQSQPLGLPKEIADSLMALLPDAWRLPAGWPAILSGSAAVSDGSRPTPLVLCDDRLYLHRYWQDEQTVARRLLAAAHPAQSEQAVLQAGMLDTLFARNYLYLFDALSALRKAGGDSAERRRSAVCDLLDVVTPDALNWPEIDVVLAQAQRFSDLTPLDTLIPVSACLNWQKVAAATALSRPFAVISGGPGTGKTTTVAKLLAALVMQNQPLAASVDASKVPHIVLVAPTGKAAARLTESIGQAVQSLPVSPALQAAIPTQASTLHRLLGAIPGRAAFRHHAGNPLHADVLVVDEASMVDLPMMARLLEALPIHTKLILLGDKDQLASVEAGAVLGDICAFARQGYSVPQAKQLSEMTGFVLPAGQSASPSPIADCLCVLQKSYRFHALSGIGQLASAINSGQPDRLAAVWQQGYSDIRQYPLEAEYYQQLIQAMSNFYSHYLKAIAAGKSPAEVLRCFASVRLLCALREGDFGVKGLNSRIERQLAKEKRISPGDETWYVGRPVMITRNDHGLGLYNGDIGIAMPDPDGRTDSRGRPALRVYFDMPDGSIRSFLPSRLPEHELVYAMTIHKSQGSEFADTLMILPPEFSLILTRELVYTGVTRAKERLYLYARPEVLQRSIQRCIQRASGLEANLS
ncbi:exodeoxyribonuclease V subunit alpha [Photobacterium galatheae]|uniref:RecBCD enzyme subunit RecD n=1 Tax=Photobacterium galatheae TaxID=1654360 RepID=A0A066RIG4_9GAMM|nr:exodeoxyribonuclease V subunit alpha [Photobacterium galatheae]KDM90200.1 exodeoxyribonuclease V subunit alpha [Photobacterium galatheae]MCM0151202.1 exodeoxyribonuclease V subunit alpha [Photobacterium galatheae]